MWQNSKSPIKYQDLYFKSLKNPEAFRSVVFCINYKTMAGHQASFDIRKTISKHGLYHVRLVHTSAHNAGVYTELQLFCRCWKASPVIWLSGGRNTGPKEFRGGSSRSSSCSSGEDRELDRWHDRTYYSAGKNITCHSAVELYIKSLQGPLSCVPTSKHKPPRWWYIPNCALHSCCAISVALLLHVSKQCVVKCTIWTFVRPVFIRILLFFLWSPFLPFLYTNI